MVQMNDLADRPARGLAHGEEIVLGKKRVRRLDAPHLPHFAALPPNVVFETRVRRADGPDRVARYTVPHVFEPSRP